MAKYDLLKKDVTFETPFMYICARVSNPLHSRIAKYAQLNLNNTELYALSR